jgi:alcohol dehydrogenase (cytochrome c)
MKPPVLVILLAIAGALGAQVGFDRILNASREPQNWLTYSGNLSSQRYSLLDQITPANAKDLELKWVFQARWLDKFETTPLVVNGVMYTIQGNDVVALDAVTGRMFWIYRYNPSPNARFCCGRISRGLAILGDTLFLGALDAHLVAIDARNGHPLWNVTVAKAEAGYSITQAPLVVKDKVLVGTAGGEYGIRGFLAAYDARTGKEAWRFNTIPGPGEPGHDTWAGSSWEHGGAPIWLTGSYDPGLNLTYWGVGNASPDWNGDDRAGDNLYTSSAIALDADTGKLKWYYQFNPHNEFDWDAVQVPVLADINWHGQPRKVMLWANRNGFFYVLDRVTGQFLLGKPFAKQNWNDGFDEKGRPIPAANTKSSREGVLIYPGNQGATNWYSPSFSPRTGLFYLSAWENTSTIFVKVPVEYKEGVYYGGGENRAPGPPGTGVGMIAPQGPNLRREEEGHGVVGAIDPETGAWKWRFKMNDVTESGVLTTASDVLFTGGREGHFFALDARTGSLLWKASLGGTIAMGPITYAVNGQQYVAAAAGNALFTFGLRERPR